ncbi:MAG TPA: SRPBCC family protein [Aestuariivirga sp.]|nr:SRPBCC family protein [Aestuariivirga sp.]
MGNTVTLHRVLKAPPERVYRAFTDAAAQAKWLPPDGFTCTVHEFNPVQDGTYRMKFTNFANGQEHAFGGKFTELIPNRKVSYTDQFEDPNMPGIMTTTVELMEVSCGTEVRITQANLPDAIPLEMCYLGWQDSLRQLAALVETAPPAE